MKTIRLSLFLLALTAVATFANARPKTFEAAVSILGQPGMDSLFDYNPESALSMNSPDGVAIDPTSGKLFVSDTLNHRILRFSSVAAYRTNSAAEAVFGQADFSSTGANRGAGIGNPSQNSFNEPANICFDDAGRLWVADMGNARVLRFDNASSLVSGAALASGVIGQPNFTSAAQADNLVTDSGFKAPTGVAVDSQGRLWVADSQIPRVLRFDNAAGPGFDVSHDGYFGEVTASVFVSGTSESQFGGELWGLAVDAHDNLWVADATNHRVLFFAGPAAKLNGASADKVLGQPDFDTSTLVSASAFSMNLPYYVTVAPDGTLWVSDYANHRVLGFPNAAGKTNGTAADIVLGQADPDSAVLYPSSPRATANPSQIAIGREGSLFIAEYIPEGHVKRWSDPVTITAPKAVTTKRTSAKIKGTSSGALSVTYKVAGQKGIKRAKGTAAHWRVIARKLTKKKTKVTVTATAFDGRGATARVKVLRKKGR